MADLRQRPEPWERRRARIVGAGWILAFHYTEWVSDWLAYVLSNWRFLEVLDYVGRFSILIAVIFYFVEYPDRTRARHYQAWAVINTAQKGGSGGRIEALEELNDDGVPLVAVDLSDAFLEKLHLSAADMRRAHLQSADLLGSKLRRTNFQFADFRSANLRGADLRGCDLNFTLFGGVRSTVAGEAYDIGADLNGANLGGADLGSAALRGADLRNVDLSNVRWQGIDEIRLANVLGVRNPPPGFLDWALARGAVALESDSQWNLLQHPAAPSPATRP